jgi:hypothetical protein
MSADDSALIDAYLDDSLSADDFRRLNERVKTDPEFARQFARAALLHDRLRSEAGLGDVTKSESPPAPLSAPARPRKAGRLLAAAFATAAAVVLGFVLLDGGGGVTPASAAGVALERIIEAAAQPVDRVYRIRITDFGPGGPQPQPAADRNGIKPHVDGAELSVRGRDQFVLIRRFADGSPFITGSDGEMGWAVPPTGHVHLSRDVRRFRRAVPGERDAIPFLDLEASLESLRRDYDLELVEGNGGRDGPEGWSRLDARKRPRVRGGAEHVQIWFDATGTAHRIALVGLPQGEPDGSPAAVEFTLLKQRDVPANYFHHETHHAPRRPVDWE